MQAPSTNALRKAAVARKAEATTEAPAPEPELVVAEAPDETLEPDAPAARKSRRPKATAEPTESDDDVR